MLGTLEAYANAPRENLDTVTLEFELPDSRRFSTVPQKALFLNPQSAVFVATNQYDQRRIRVRAAHQDLSGRRRDIGMLDIELGGLVATHEVEQSDASIAWAQFAAAPAEAETDGAVTGLAVQPDTTNLATEWSEALPGAEGHCLKVVQATVSATDYQLEPIDGPPDLQLALWQDGKLVFMTPKVDDRYEALWTANSTCIFVRPLDRIEMRPVDRDATQDDVNLQATLSADQIRTGLCEVRAAGGTTVSLEWQPRRSGPE